MKSKKSEETLAQVHLAENSKGFSSVSSCEKEIRKDNFEKRIDELMKIKEEKFKQREVEKKKKKMKTSSSSARSLLRSHVNT